jgi:hypothetical protein
VVKDTPSGFPTSSYVRQPIISRICSFPAKILDEASSALGDVAVRIAKVLIENVDVRVDTRNVLAPAVISDGEYGEGQDHEAADGEGKPQEVERQGAFTAGTYADTARGIGEGAAGVDHAVNTGEKPDASAHYRETNYNGDISDHDTNLDPSQGIFASLTQSMRRWF